MWIVGYGVLFGMLTLQDRLSGPQAVPYTEFKGQVAAKNVTEVFAKGDTIEGALKRPCPCRANRIARTSSSQRNDQRLRTMTCWQNSRKEKPLSERRQSSSIAGS